MQKPWAVPGARRPGESRRALDPAHFGERIRAAPQSPRLCWIPCLSQATGDLRDPPTVRVAVAARLCLAKHRCMELVYWPHRAGRQRLRGPGLRI